MLNISKADINPYRGKTPFDRACAFWFNDLIERVASLFQYEGLPPSINPLYLETVLLTQGFIIWSKDKKGVLRALRGSVEGLDCYNFPVRGIIANHVLGNWKTTFHVDSVLGLNNRFGTPATTVISYYAEQLATLDTDIISNLDNLKLTKIFHADNNEQAQKIRRFIDEIKSGKMAVITTSALSELFDDESHNIPFYSDPFTYVVDKLLKDRRTIINDFLTKFGVNNCAVEKAERLITDEVNANNEEIANNRRYWLSTREEMCAEVNHIFKENISVKYCFDNFHLNGKRGIIDNDSARE